MVVRDALLLPEAKRARVVQDPLDSLSPEASSMFDDARAAEFLRLDHHQHSGEDRQADRMQDDHEHQDSQQCLGAVVGS